ncbi:MAG: PilZ domain-containing protein [Sneathiella sp.]|nr:PilZ domain-containing protein [Sneathiella sp.]
MQETEDSNRRQHKRILVSNPTTVESDSGSYTGRILNISAGGAGIRMDVCLLDDTRLTVNIENVGMIPAKVVRQMRDGVGVKFEISEDKEKRFIKKITDIVEKKRQELLTGTS